MTTFTSRSTFCPNTIGKSSGKILGLLSFLLAVISLLGVIYVWLVSGAPMKLPSADMITQAIDGSSQEVEASWASLSDFTATQQTLSETQANLAALEAVQKKTETSLESLQSHDLTALKLAEIKYLLKLANHRVLLINDIDGGIALLEAADSSMVGQDIANSLSIRQAIAQDIAALKSLPSVDVEGIYSQLSALTIQTAQLPQFEIKQHKTNIKTIEENAEASGKSEAEIIDQLTTPEYESAESFAEKVKASSSRSAKSLWERIGVNYYSDFKAQPILSPEQHFVFTQNVRLLIEEAKVALLTGEQVIFEKSLKEAESLLAMHAQNVAQAKPMRESLALLQQQQILKAEPKELTSLRALLGKAVKVNPTIVEPQTIETKPDTATVANAGVSL